MGDIKYIDRIQVSNFWGLYDVDWKLDPSVNILIGKNGSGKSTLLDLLEESFEYGNSTGSEREKFLNGEAYLGNEYTGEIKFTFNNDQVLINILMRANGSQSHSSLPSNFIYQLIRTFDANLIDRDPFEKKDKPSIKTPLDYILNELIDEYVEYQLNLTKRIINHNEDKKDVFKRFELFHNFLDELFGDSNKTSNRDANRIDFLLNDKVAINVTQLSAGEKQLLIILITVLIQDGKPATLLLDEPEVSLHIDWQYKFIDILKQINPNCQLIIATHSPSIFGENGEYPIYFMEDVLGIKESVNG